MRRFNSHIALFLMVGLLTACGGARRNTVLPTVQQESAAADPGVTANKRQLILLSDSILRHRSADTIDMGRMYSGEIVLRRVLLRNEADTPLVILGLDKTCDCVDVKYPKVPLKPGEEQELELSFDSKRLSGWVYKTVGIRTSLGAKPYILVVTADVE